MREHRIEYVVQHRTPADWVGWVDYERAVSLQDAHAAMSHADSLPMRWLKEYRIVVREITETVL